MSSRRSKSIVTCGQSHREADGAVWGFAIESFKYRSQSCALTRPVILLDQQESHLSEVLLKNTREQQYCEIKR